MLRSASAKSDKETRAGHRHVEGLDRGILGRGVDVPHVGEVGR